MADRFRSFPPLAQSWAIPSHGTQKLWALKPPSGRGRARDFVCVVYCTVIFVYLAFDAIMLVNISQQGRTVIVWRPGANIPHCAPPRPRKKDSGSFFFEVQKYGDSLAKSTKFGAIVLSVYKISKFQSISRVTSVNPR